MGFLDNLENNLKNLESAEDGKDAASRQSRARERGRAEALAIAPWAEQLKTAPFTAELFRQAARVGHALRVKVQMVWIGATLRLEARNRRLELRPTPAGIVAVYIEDQAETRRAPLDLAANPEALLRDWLG